MQQALRALPGLGGAAVADHATDACGQRTHVCGLCRHDDGRYRRRERRGTAGAFVAVLGASSYTYAEATWTQGLADWIGSHTRTFAFVDGVPAMVVSDNLRSGITKSCFY